MFLLLLTIHSLLQKMTLEEKIGQLFMVAGYVDRDFAHLEIGNPNIIEEIDSYIRQYHIGGIVFVGPSNSREQVRLTNHYQEISKYPLLIAQDLEWGLGMRLKDGFSFPKNNTLGALTQPHLVYQMGQEIGRQAKLIGVHMNLSPVVDIVTHSQNLVLHLRSFGNSPQKVAQFGVAMVQGLQDEGVIASAKHFPGLGAITLDPHFALPTTSFQEEALLPFIEAIKAGVFSIQTEHIFIPELDPIFPASLSNKVVEGVLKTKLGFSGVVLSGALRMKALTNYFSEEEIILRAFLAGHDLLLMPKDLPKAYDVIHTACKEGVIRESEIDQRLLKILKLKENIPSTKIVPPKYEELHPLSAQQLKKEIYKNVITLLRNQYNHLPLSSQQKIAYLQLGESPSSFLDKVSSKIDLIPFSEKSSLDDDSLIIFALFPKDPSCLSFLRLKGNVDHFRIDGISEDWLPLIENLEKYQEKILLLYFGNSFGLPLFERYSTLLLAHDAEEEAQEAALNLLLDFSSKKE